jgi:CBS domain containing-hemolysin-like protein
MDILVPILVIMVLVLLNGLFVAAEFAIVGVPRATIERMASGGDRRARQAWDIIHDPRRLDRFIATAQLGITLASLGLGMYGEHALAGWIAAWLEPTGVSAWIATHVLASILSVAVLTYIHIVIGEMVPKSLALMSADRTVLWITPPMRWIQYAMWPLVVGLNAIGNGVMRAMGVRRELDAGQLHTSAEIAYLVRESEEGGLLRAEAGRVLRDLFEFGELTAGMVMVPRVRVKGLPVGATAAEVSARIRASQHTRYPVYEGDLDHILGMLHIKDLFPILREGRPLTRDDVRPLPYLPETAELDTVLAIMRREQAQMAVVMDEHGGTAGVVTLEDLFEEVVGDIDDGGADVPELAWSAPGILQVSGTARLDEVGEMFGVTLEHEDVDTVSGLVLALLDRPPVVGDEVACGVIRFTVTDVDGHGVGAARAVRGEPREGGAGPDGAP